MKIYIGSDHAGFELKEELKKYLTKLKVDYVDLGNHEYESADDYPDYAKIVAEKVVKLKSKGILVCGSGVGVCMTANKTKGARAVNVYNAKVAEKSREHNNANIICFGQDYVKPDQAKKMLKIWLDTKFSSEARHVRRVKKMNKL